MKKLELILYLPNKPDLDEYKSKQKLKNLKIAQVAEIINYTGNHWRKIFSIFSKISCALDDEFKDLTWQEYRDQILLTRKKNETISFSNSLQTNSKNAIHIITGKYHYEKFDLPFDEFKKVDREGRVLNYKNIYLTPYFDYRQFPNDLVEAFVEKLKASN